MPRPPRAKKTAENTSELPDDWSYEDTLTRIDTITRQLETGDLPLADVFDQFAEAVTALQACDRFLQAKQQQAALMIETLVGEDEPD
ncbi:MAG: exodeoxyribonuclease VII small subunit [Cyanobacteria bacterium J06614_10]